MMIILITHIINFPAINMKAVKKLQHLAPLELIIVPPKLMEIFLDDGLARLTRFTNEYRFAMPSLSGLQRSPDRSLINLSTGILTVSCNLLGILRPSIAIEANKVKLFTWESNISFRNYSLSRYRTPKQKEVYSVMVPYNPVYPNRRMRYSINAPLFNFFVSQGVPIL